MARLKIRLARNLRKSILRGHPWVYREALAEAPALERAQLCQVSDAKGELAWALYDPRGPLALRILSLGRAPPAAAEFEARFQRALSLRRSMRTGSTDCFRLFNGEGDGLPGLICDVYAAVAVLQFDGLGPSEFWDREVIARWLLERAGVETVVEKLRRNKGAPAAERSVRLLAGVACPDVVTVRENGAAFRVNLELGQKTGFFLDQRANRHYVGGVARAQNILNLFSYSGGFSVAAGLGGASRVTSVDVSAGAVALADENWQLNGLAPGAHVGVCADVFEFLKDGRDLWDHVIVDPPSMGHSEDGKAAAVAKYVALFAAAAAKTRPDGELSLSSCSSHVSFDDFLASIDEALSASRRRAQVLRISGQGPDHPFPHACPELRYLKFAHLAMS